MDEYFSLFPNGKSEHVFNGEKNIFPEGDLAAPKNWRLEAAKLFDLPPASDWKPFSDREPVKSISVRENTKLRNLIKEAELLFPQAIKGAFGTPPLASSKPVVVKDSSIELVPKSGMFSSYPPEKSSEHNLLTWNAPQWAAETIGVTRKFWLGHELFHIYANSVPDSEREKMLGSLKPLACFSDLIHRKLTPERLTNEETQRLSDLAFAKQALKVGPLLEKVPRASRREREEETITKIFGLHFQKAEGRSQYVNEMRLRWRGIPKAVKDDAEELERLTKFCSENAAVDGAHMQPQQDHQNGGGGFVSGNGTESPLYSVGGLLACLKDGKHEEVKKIVALLKHYRAVPVDQREELAGDFSAGSLAAADIRSRFPPSQWKEAARAVLSALPPIPPGDDDRLIFDELGSKPTNQTRARFLLTNEDFSSLLGCHLEAKCSP